MPQILAWQCSETNNIFGTRTGYIKHLKRIARKNLDALYHSKRVASREVVFKQMREECRTTQDIEDFVKEHWDVFLSHAIEQRSHGEYVGVKLKSIKINMSASIGEFSNSHSAPIGESQQWSNPTKFPAFVGTLHCEVSENCSMMAEFMRIPGAYPGSGSGAFGRYACKFVLWAQDWPGLVAEVEHRAIVSRLTIPNMMTV